MPALCIKIPLATRTSSQEETGHKYRTAIQYHCEGDGHRREYRALAELRYNILRFLHDGDPVARKVGLPPQQYLMLLAIQGLPLGDVATIRTLAERVALKHHSAVELVDRLEKHGYVRRNRGEADRRLVTVSLLPKGERLLEEVMKHRVGELQAGGHWLVKAINRLLVYPRRQQDRGQAGISLRGKVRDKT